MKNTEIYLWLMPVVVDHQKYDGGKMYFKCIIEGDRRKEDLEYVVDRELIIRNIMDFADIEINGDYKVISSLLTTEDPGIELADSPRQTEIKKKVALIVADKKELALTESNVEIKDGGMIEVTVPGLDITQKIDFQKIWDALEKNFIGKIEKGDSVVLTAEDGSVIFEMMGGNFLNVAVADMSIYDKKKYDANASWMNNRQALKGGLFIREDGSLDIGDLDRTFYLKIYTNNLLKQSLKLNKSIMENVTKLLTEAPSTKKIKS